MAQLQALEARHSARLGVHARNHRTGATIDYRADERFATCSVFKGLLAAHVLRDFDRRGEFLNRLIHYTKADLIEGAPVTGQYVDTGLTVRALCAAALAYSDNTAANLLLALTGGPRGVTRFCRSIGDTVTRLDRTEPTLNTSIPGDPRDTTTPRAIGDSYGRLVLGRSLSRPGPGPAHLLAAGRRGQHDALSPRASRGLGDRRQDGDRGLRRRQRRRHRLDRAGHPADHRRADGQDHAPMRWPTNS